MNRDALLEAVFARPVDELPVPSQWFNYEDPDRQGHVFAVVGLGTRRVIVRHSTPPGADIGVATTTIPVAAIMNVCTDPDHRGKGYATLQLLAALEAATTHELTDWAALFAGAEVQSFCEQFGFYHPDGSPAEFMVCDLHDEPWPEGSVMIREQW